MQDKVFAEEVSSWQQNPKTIIALHLCSLSKIAACTRFPPLAASASPFICSANISLHRLLRQGVRINNLPKQFAYLKKHTNFGVQIERLIPQALFPHSLRTPPSPAPNVCGPNQFHPSDLGAFREGLKQELAIHVSDPPPCESGARRLCYEGQIPLLVFAGRSEGQEPAGCANIWALGNEAPATPSMH